jgi:hypothetical protein
VLCATHPTILLRLLLHTTLHLLKHFAAATSPRTLLRLLLEFPATLLPLLLLLLLLLLLACFLLSRLRCCGFMPGIARGLTASRLLQCLLVHCCVQAPTCGTLGQLRLWRVWQLLLGGQREPVCCQRATQQDELALQLLSILTLTRRRHVLQQQQ